MTTPTITLPPGAEPILAYVREHIGLVEPIIFSLGFAESIVFLSLLVPASPLFLAIGGLHGAAGGSLATTWIAGTAGAFVGDVVSYAIGRWFKDDVGQIWPFRTKAGWYVRTVRFFQRWGMLGIIAGKFLGVMRPFLPVVAGAMLMPWPKFLLASLISSALWAGAFLAPGYSLTILVK